MKLLRTLRPSDREQARALWKLLFSEDPLPFVDWFFTHRYRPDSSICLEVDGRIVSCAHGTPCRVRLRGAAVPAMMISGVSTHPDFQRQGCMHLVMQRMLYLCRDAGIPTVLLKPQTPGTYDSLDLLVCTRERMLHTVGAAPADSPLSVTQVDAAALFDCYQRAIAQYSGCVIRSAEDMAQKLSEHASDGGRVAVLEEKGRICGYSLLTPGPSGWSSEETLAENPAAYSMLMERLPAGASVLLPPDAACQGELMGQNAMGVADVPSLLRMVVSDDSLTFSVHDSVIPENAGVFDGCGRRIASQPAAHTLSAGQLMQGLCGYTALGKLPEAVTYCADAY